MSDDSEGCGRANCPACPDFPYECHEHPDDGSDRAEQVRAEVERLTGLRVRAAWCRPIEPDGTGFWALAHRRDGYEYGVAIGDCDAERLARAFWLAALADQPADDGGERVAAFAEYSKETFATAAKNYGVPPVTTSLDDILRSSLIRGAIVNADGSTTPVPDPAPGAPVVTFWGEPKE